MNISLIIPLVTHQRKCKIERALLLVQSLVYLSTLAEKPDRENIRTRQTSHETRGRKKKDGKKKKHFHGRNVLLVYDRFYPLQSRDRECISSSAVKRGTAGKLRTLPIQSIFVLRISRARATVHHHRSNDYGLAPTSTCGVKEKAARTLLPS